MAEIKIKTAGGGQLNEPKKPNKLKELLASLLFYLSILFFFIGFQFSDTMVNGWYQQFMPNLGGRQIVDITFTDSLNGYAITNEVSDTSFILRTTNSGDNWFLSHFDTGVCTYYNVQFINQSTGFVSGYIYDGSLFKIVKTTNAGLNWFYINAPFDIIAFDMSVLNEDSIWMVDAGGLTGGVFRTTNGGASWDRQLNLGSQNPSNIYMYNGRIGYIAKNTGSPYIRKTTNSGLNWDTIVNGQGFRDMYFVDSLMGWRSYIGYMLKTTNGGLNWVQQSFPPTYITGVEKFTNVNRDTIWGVGGTIGFPNNQTRGIVYNTIDGGNNWRYQIPDTNINIFEYFHTKFVNKLVGWAYAPLKGVHTTTGGNDTFYTSVNLISSNVPDEFILGQNYPNPFNPITKISYELSRGVGTGENSSYVKILAFDITGKEIEILVDQKQNTGKYEVTFDGTNYSSGVYFYSLYVDGKLVDTKKMVLVK